jgi:uncharacterized membrane protein YphA (DoxX/SURF4 family)
MTPQKFNKVAALVLRVMLGCWFAYSGGVKIFGSGLDRFVVDVANYRIISPPLDAWVAYSVPFFELVAGICLMLGVLRRGALLAIFGLVLVFSVAVGSAWVRGLDISCGCLGGDALIRYWAKAVEFAGYFLILGWMWRLESHADGSDDVENSRNLA